MECLPYYDIVGYSIVEKLQKYDKSHFHFQKIEGIL
jgi:hypothetical protein